MNLSLNEWNNLLAYGNAVCSKLKKNGHNVKLKPYTMYDRSKGLSIQVFDSEDKFFTEYLSGIGPFEYMKKVLALNAKRIELEC